MAITSTNPATGQVLKVFTELTDDEVDDRLARAAAAFPRTAARPSPTARRG